MQINDHKKLAEIQQEFQQRFPNLKIEFYRLPHEEGKGSPERLKLDAQLTIGEARSIHNTGDMSINSQQKVSTLENNFRDVYGLNVQVFRRSGSIYLQTITTDEWTLAEQDRRGARTTSQNTERS